MNDFMDHNLPLIYFVYGLSFFVPGFIILYQSLKDSKIGLSSFMKYLGLFFLLHGIGDWAPVFFPYQKEIYTENIMMYLQSSHLLVVIFSYYFLFIYGIKVITKNNSLKNKLFLQIPNIALLFFVFVITILFFKSNFEHWHNNVDILVRYILGFPSAVLTAIALKNERDLFKANYLPSVRRCLRVTSITFFIYAFISGIIVPKGEFFPANLINNESFFNIVGIQIQFFRALCGVIVAYSMINILGIFQRDFIKKLEEAEKESVILGERQRISQDIHDGTMQALYGVGLRLQYVESQLKDYPDEAIKEHLHYTIKKIGATSKEIRSYITDLRPRYEDSELIGEIKNIVTDFISESNIQIRFDYDQAGEIDIKPYIISQLSFIVKEALNNIRKHSEASIGQIVLKVFEGKIELTIKDNGCGYNCVNEECLKSNNVGFGLKNMFNRVQDLHGVFNISSNSGSGMGISIIIPLEGK